MALATIQWVVAALGLSFVTVLAAEERAVARAVGFAAVGLAAAPDSAAAAASASLPIETRQPVVFAVLAVVLVTVLGELVARRLGVATEASPAV